MAEDDGFDYGARAQDALLGLVRDVLQETAEHGLPGAHHFYISFRTRAENLLLSRRLRDENPEEMTIVLENQFERLKISEDGFSVRLHFNHRQEDLYIPFAAITKFYDPVASFGLVFENYAEDEPKKPKARQDKKPAKNTKKPTTGEVINLDSFRNK